MVHLFFVLFFFDELSMYNNAMLSPWPKCFSTHWLSNSNFKHFYKDAWTRGKVTWDSLQLTETVATGYLDKSFDRRYISLQNLPTRYLNSDIELRSDQCIFQWKYIWWSWVACNFKSSIECSIYINYIENTVFIWYRLLICSICSITITI